MTGRPGPGKVTKKHKLKSVTQSSRAGLTLPVGRVNRILRNGRYAPRIGLDAAVYLTGVLEYLCGEILELAMRAADDNGRVRISPRHLLLAVGKDDELSRLLEGVIISGGGVIPYIHPNLIPYKAPARNNDTSSQEY